MNRRTALAADLVRAHDLAHTLTLKLARDSHLARDCHLACDLARDLTLDLDLVRARGRNRAFARTFACDLARDLDLVLRLRAPDEHPTAAAGAQLMPGRVSRGLLALGVRLLPPAQRRRYDAEFRGELGELRCRERWGYVLRVLVGAWKLRRAQVEPVRTPDGDVARRAER